MLKYPMLIITYSVCSGILKLFYFVDFFDSRRGIEGTYEK